MNLRGEPLAAVAPVEGRPAAPLAQGGWRVQRWLIARRTTQLGVLALFLAGPLFGVWIVKGNLASSLTLGVLPLSDPFVLLQSLAARHWPETSALIGAALVLAFYALVGGRAYCAWVCPVNVVTDTAAWARRRLGLKGGRTPPKSTRYWLLGAVLLAALLSGSMIWEAVNPVTLTQRALIFGGTLAFAFPLAVFVFDFAVAPRGWCGHLCPMGACYSLLGKVSLLRVSAARRAACNDCMDCYAVCPEPQVISPALRGKGAATPLILSGTCSNCARCIDVCRQNVFRLTLRFDHRSES